nr:hypothetical protein [Chitinilyticum aquatile]
MFLVMGFTGKQAAPSRKATSPRSMRWSNTSRATTEKSKPARSCPMA